MGIQLPLSIAGAGEVTTSHVYTSYCILTNYRDKKIMAFGVRE